MLTSVDIGQPEFVLTSLRVTVTRYSAVLMSMHVESSTMLGRTLLELPLHGVDSFSEDPFV